MEKKYALRLFKGGHVYGPEDKGITDILVSGEMIIDMQKEIQIEGTVPLEIIDCRGRQVIPGIIDNHVHITGGFANRIREIEVDDLIPYGTTTVIGMLGTDGFARDIKSLLAKAKGLNEQGMTAYALTGSYQVPVRTLTDTIEEDLMFVKEIIGVGEIAVSDHRDAAPTVDELRRIVSSARIGGLLTGKAGEVNFHLGGGSEGMTPIFEMVKKLVNDEVMDLSQALGFVTVNPAKVYALHEKGCLDTGCDADLVILDDAFFLCAVRHNVACYQLKSLLHDRAKRTIIKVSEICIY